VAHFTLPTSFTFAFVFSFAFLHHLNQLTIDALLPRPFLFCPGPFVTEFAAPAVVACAGAGPLRLLNHSVDALTLVQIVRLDQLTCAFLRCAAFVQFHQAFETAQNRNGTVRAA